MFRSKRTSASGVIARAELRDAQRGATTAKIVVLTITGFIVAAIWLAIATTVPELVRASGTLIPTGHYQQLQAPEGGIVADVLIEEGERVEKNQVLTVLSSPDLESALREAKREKHALETRVENLREIVRFAGNNQEVREKEFDGSGALDLSYASSQLSLFTAKQAVQIERRQHLEKTLVTLRNAHELTKERVKSRVERVKRAEQLFENNLTPRRDLDLQRDGLDQLQANLIEIEVRLSQARKELGEVGVTLEQNLIALLEKTNEEKFDLEQRIEMLAGQVTALEARRQALNIRAPETGIIHAIGFPNPGEVIAPGTTLFELMPAPQRLIAQLEIDPVDIGHIGRGDAVSLKFDTFDARRYGQVKGQIARISPNSVIDPQTGSSHFRATIALDRATIGQGEWERQLQAGMGTSAEIVTDERTVLAYLFKPINRSFDNAFGER